MAATTTTSRNARARVSLSKIAWLYLHFQSRGDFARAAATLSYFQSTYSGYSAFVIEGLQDLVEAGVLADTVRMPTTLRPSGVWDESTATAMAGILAWAAYSFGYGQAQSQAALDLIIAEMPLVATAIGPWFARMQSALPPGSALYQYIEIFGHEPLHSLVEALEIQSFGFIEGVEPDPVQMTHPDLAQNVRQLLEQSSTPPRQVVDLEAEGATTFVTAPVSTGWKMPTWGWVVAGTAGAAALGWLAWWGYQKSKRGRRRR